MTAERRSETGEACVIDLVLTHGWYDKVEAGEKRVEYRTPTPFWLKRIWARRHEITHLRVRRGYTSRSLTFPVSAIDNGPCPYSGWVGQFIRIHFTD